MPAPMAVLSYTRKDDEFYGGYITAFRKTLENAVHVVSGDERFRLFQDIEGIVIGEQWQKKLAEVIGAADFLVPMVSPLFLNSQPCRQEVDLFLAHERELKRDDLILPVYFQSCVKFEKEDEKGKDPVAVELARRQMFDWRDNADLPLQDPVARKAIKALAAAIVAAIGRLASPRRDATPTSAREAERSPHTDVPVTDRYANTKREKLAECGILWVDDNPNNNVWERRALEAYSVRFTLATSTEEAADLLEHGKEHFAAIISDMGRRGDRQAGYTLLARIRAAGVQTPYFIYSSARSPEHVREAFARGAQGATNDPDELVAMVVGAIR